MYLLDAAKIIKRDEAVPLPDGRLIWFASQNLMWVDDCFRYFPEEMKNISKSWDERGDYKITKAKHPMLKY